jgi:hypothetical protein
MASIATIWTSARPAPGGVRDTLLRRAVALLWSNCTWAITQLAAWITSTQPPPGIVALSWATEAAPIPPPASLEAAQQGQRALGEPSGIPGSMGPVTGPHKAQTPPSRKSLMEKVRELQEEQERILADNREKASYIAGLEARLGALEQLVGKDLA